MNVRALICCCCFFSLVLLLSLPLRAAEDSSVSAPGSKKILAPVSRPPSITLSTHTGQAPATGNGIIYHGGSVLVGVTNIYYIWYGNWRGDPNALPILQNFASSIGGSPYYAIDTTYSDLYDTSVSNAVSFNGSTTDNYSQGTALSDAGVLAVVSSAIASGSLPNDTNGVYFVLTSPDVVEGTGYLTKYCAWHNHGRINGFDIKYAFVGDPETQGLSACAGQTASSPNGDPAADAMANLIAHEFQESVTDPDLNAWYDANGLEMADKCVWTFGTTYSAPNGSLANMNLGGLNYLIQQVWVNAGGGYCALALPPSIASLSPNDGQQGSAVPVSIAGSNLSGGTLSLSGTGVAAVVLSSSSTQISATLTIAASAAVGPYNVSVTTVGGTSASLPFTVTAGSGVPVLTSINPSSATQGSSVNVTLTGTNFTPQAAIRLAGAGATPSNVVVVSSTQIAATFTFSSTAATGPHNIYVVTAAGNSNFLSFTVSAPAPVLSSISPSSMVQGASTNVTLSGANFVSGAAVNVSGSGVTVSNVVVVSPTQITAALVSAANASPGAYSVTVTTPSGTSGTAAFTVIQAPPALSSISPSTASQGTSVAVTLMGTNIVSPATVNVSGTGITVSNTIVVSSSQMTATLTIAASVGVGQYNVSVTTGGGTSASLPFTVTARSGVPVLTSINPSSATQGSSVNVTLTGTNFTPQSGVRLAGAGAAQGNVVVVSSTQITATFTFSSTAATGPHNIYVVTAAGNSNFLSFTVSAPAPVLSSISPSSMVQGASTNVTLSGANFVSGAAVNVSGSGVTVSNVVVVSPTQITAALVSAANASPGAYSVTVTTPSGTSGTAAFTVIQAPPALSSISPSTASQGTSVAVTLMGTNIVSPATVNVSGTGITVSNTIVVSSSQMTATLTIAASVGVGQYNVSVTTGGGTSASLPFTVTARSGVPVLTSINPSSATQGSSVNVTLTGTNFTPQSGVRLAGAGAAQGNVVVVSSTQITATFTFSTTAATGPHNIYVVTAAGNSNVLSFTVN